MKQLLRFQIEAVTVRRARLDQFLASRIHWLSRMRIGALLAEGACAVNGDAGRAGYHLSAGDVVEITLDESAPTAMTPERLPLEIVHEDEDLLVVVKPSGMLVHPTRNVKSGTLLNALAYHFNGLRTDANVVTDFTDFEYDASLQADYATQLNHTRVVIRPGLVHRLDRATSGLMAIAKHQRALSHLTRQFQQRRVEKRYLALVHGVVREDETLIDAPIGRGAELRPFWHVMKEGKAAETRLRVLDRRSDRTLVELVPLTGRTNQLRIHCAHTGHPIIGDEWYGSRVRMRLCLHAARLAFRHPSNGERTEFNSPLPFEIAQALNNQTESDTY